MPLFFGLTVGYASLHSLSYPYLIHLVSKTP